MRKYFLVLLQTLAALLPLPALAGNGQEAASAWVYLARHSAFEPSGPGLPPGLSAAPSASAWYLHASGFFQAVELDSDGAVLNLREKPNARALYGEIEKVLAQTAGRALPADAGVTYAGIEAVSVPERAIIYAGAGKIMRVIYSGPLRELPQELRPLLARLARENAATPARTTGAGWLRAQPDLDASRKRAITMTPEKIARAPDLAKALNAPMRMIEIEPPGAAATVLGVAANAGNWIATLDYQGQRYTLRRHSAPATLAPSPRP